MKKYQFIIVLVSLFLLDCSFKKEELINNFDEINNVQIIVKEHGGIGGSFETKYIFKEHKITKKLFSMVIN